MKKRVGLRVLLESLVDDLNRLDLLVYQKEKHKEESASTCEEERNGERTHSEVTRSEKSGDLWLMRKESLEEVDRPIEPERVSKVLEESSGEMIRDHGSDLDLWI